MNHHFLVLLDKDKTLVNVQYEFTTPVEDLRGAIIKLQGIIPVGLNSDSPYLSLQNLHSELQMQGPIVSERGAMTHWQVRSLVKRTGPDIVDNFIQIIDEFSELLVDSGYTVYSGNPGQILVELRRHNDWRNAIVMNTLRTCSLCFYARKRSATSEVYFDDALLDTAVSMLKKLLNDKYPQVLAEAEFDVNREYGICILHNQQTIKLLAAQYLLDECGVSRIYMIGDSMSDYIDDSRVIHLAVANAKAEFKKKSFHVAKCDITSGAIELLEWIYNNEI